MGGQQWSTVVLDKNGVVAKFPSLDAAKSKYPDAVEIDASDQHPGAPLRVIMQVADEPHAPAVYNDGSEESFSE